MRKRDFFVALAVCAGLAGSGMSLLDFASAGDQVAMMGSPTPAAPAPLPLPQEDKVEPKPTASPGAPQSPQVCEPPEEDEDEDEGDGCPACGMARVEPRGKDFLQNYSN